MTDTVEGKLKVAYVMSRFPKLTETFILHEMIAVEGLGVEVSLYPLLRERGDAQPEAVRWIERARYQPFISWSILRSQLHFLRRSPRRYLSTLALALRHTFGSRNFFFGALGIFPKAAHIARLMEIDGVDHAHCHFANHPALAGWIVHRLVGIPYSFTTHGSDLHVERRMLCVKLRDALFAVTVSEFNRNLMTSECPKEGPRVEIVHCGVDTQRFRPRPREASNTFRILCIGTLHEVKGQTYLIEACRILADAGIAFECTLVGDGVDRQRLEGQVRRLGLESRVRFAGQRSSGEIATMLSTTDALVAPSVPASDGKKEGIPVVLMEAMSSGVPVVASRLTGIPELVRPGVSGLLVEPGDAAGIAAALMELERDEHDRRRLGSGGRAMIEAEFDVRKNAAALVSLIQTAVAAQATMLDQRQIDATMSGPRAEEREDGWN